MDQLELFQRGQWWVLTQLCFTRYEIAVLQGQSHVKAHEIAIATMNQYLEISQLRGTDAAEDLIQYVTQALDILVSFSRRNDQMN